jgi:F-type H+-transporting ATPase subunit delta
MLSHTVARRYAKGLLGAITAIASGSESRVKDQLAGLVATIEEHDGLRLLIRHPAVDEQDKKAILGKITEVLGLDEPARRFIDVLADKKRLDHLSLITEVYGELVDEHSGVVTAHITTAKPLNPGQIAELEASLCKATGAEVRISRNTDARLLGGVVTRIGDVVYDGSLQGHLARIRERLEST